MTVIIHHLEISRGSKLIWLCEEAGIAYEIRRMLIGRELIGAAG